MRERLARAHLALFLPVALLVFACTGSEPPERVSLPETLEIPTATTGVTGSLPGRLLVLDEDDGIVTVRPDGGDRVTLAEPDPDIERAQPTWSPDGSRVAWTERRDKQETFFIVSAADGADIVERPSPVQAVYIAWGPDSEHIAITGNAEDGNLLLVVADPEGELTVIEEGAPLYFDWAPEGSEVLARVGDRFGYIAVDGSGRTPVPVSGEFRLGAHLGESVVLGTGRDIGEALATANREGEVERELLRYAAPMAFVVDDISGRLAVMMRGSPESQQLSQVEESDLPIIEPDQLVVVDATDGDLVEVSRARNIAWFWSPGGDRLLYTTVEFLDGVERLRLHTWDGERTTSHQAFSPTGVFGREYLAYFDQFALSFSLWAPDSSAFAYAGGSSLEDAGIWVQPLDGDEPSRVSSGQMAVWSPV